MLLVKLQDLDLDISHLFVLPSDIEKQVHELATAVYQIRGHIKGLTLLPFPQGAEGLDAEEERVRESHGREVDMTLKNNIEAIVSKWSYQVGDIDGIF